MRTLTSPFLTLVSIFTFANCSSVVIRDMTETILITELCTSTCRNNRRNNYILAESIPPHLYFLCLDKNVILLQ